MSRPAKPAGARLTRTRQGLDAGLPNVASLPPDSPVARPQPAIRRRGQPRADRWVALVRASLLNQMPVLAGQAAPQSTVGQRRV